MTEPLTPANLNLQSMSFMPLDVVRLRDSSMASQKSAEGFRAAVLLWCAAWHQVPAASLPNDDVELARYAGFGRDLKAWTKIRDIALHGFVECSDGRLYHRVIASKANETAAKREAYRQRTKNATEARQRRNAERNDQRNVQHDSERNVHQGKVSVSKKEREEDTANAVSSSQYVFESGVIRLTQKDFDQWKEAYSYLDLRAELLSLTDFAQKNAEKWFFAVAGALAKRNREAKLAKERAGKGEFRLMSGIEGVL